MKKPTYARPKTSFMNDTRTEVMAFIKQNPKGKTPVHLKAIFLILLFASGTLLLWQSESSLSYLFCAAALGVLTLPIILNIGHEAVHGSFSKNKKINKWGKMVFHLLGTSAYFWELRHISSHHVYANVSGWDMDIEQSSVIRLADQQQHKPRHKYQHLYMPFVFCFYTLIWFFLRDFKDITTHKFGNKRVDKHPRIELLKLLLAKVFHLQCFIGIPLLLGHSATTTLLGFLTLHISASIVTTFALVSTHVGEEQEIVPNTQELPYSWAEHQLKTTADFGSSSWFLTHYFGGFNHHIAHHLFPNVSQVYYPKITQIIKKQATTNGLTYHHYSNLFLTAISHIRRLKTLSVEPDI